LVKGGLADAVLTAKVYNLNAIFMLRQNRNNLTLGKLGLFHDYEI
jgi:hypothetical protein